MVSFSTPALFALAFSILANGLAIPKDDSIVSDLAARDDKFLKLDFTVKTKTNTSILTAGPYVVLDRSIEKRSKPVGVTLTNQGFWYSVDIEVGSNKQKLTVDIDTGSSDLWFVANNVKCAPVKNAPADYCKEDGSFDKSKSSSFKSLNSPFSIGYADGSTSSGTWATDDVTLPGGPTIKKVQFADVTTTSVGQGGILGIGFVSTESEEKPSDYDNFPILLKKQGLISKVAYSFFLNDQQATTGSVIFGGIDNAKYEGKLSTLPVDSDELTISLDTIDLGSKGSFHIGGPALLDSGTTLTYLPSDAFQNAADSFGAQYDNNVEGYIVDCNQPSGYATYTFGQNTQIKVPFTELAIPILDNEGQSTGSCLFGYQPGADDDPVILGDNFMRSSYIVYNLDDKEISIAQVKFTSASSISAI